MIAGGCSLSDEQPVEGATQTIAEDVLETSLIPARDEAVTQLPAETSDDTGKIIVRRPRDRFAVNLTGMPSTAFGDVDHELLEIASGTKIDYTVHSSALSIRVGKNGHSIRQRFDPSVEGSARVEFAASIPEADDESWLSYSVFFEKDWEWNKGGKLPGLAGGTHPTAVGGDGTDGFSARLAWMPTGQLGIYLYHPDRPNELGELRATFGMMKKNNWHNITQRVVMNSEGQSDGILEVWLDDLLVLSDHAMTWRTTGTFGADVFLYSAFYGGVSADWSPSTTTFARFANIKVSTTDTSVQTLSR